MCGASSVLLLQEYVCKVTQAQQTLKETQAVLQEKTILTNFVTAQDRRTLDTACCCLDSLRIRVEALTNSVELLVRRRQISLMQDGQLGCPADNLSAQTIRNLASSTHHSVSPSNALEHP